MRKRPRKLYDKLGNYVPNTGKAKTAAVGLAVTAFSVFLCFIALAFFLNWQAARRYDMREQFLLSTERPCTIEISIAFDREPIDFNIVTPTGEWKGTADFTSYEITDNQINATLVTDLQGDWMIRYNIKSNRNTDISVTEKDIERLYIKDFNIEVNGEVLTLSFTPAFGDLSDQTTQLTCSAVLISGVDRYILYDGNMTLNVHASMKYTVDPQVIAAHDDWMLLINLAHEDGIALSDYLLEYTAGPAPIDRLNPVLLQEARDET